MFQYKGMQVTLENYRVVFGTYPVDVLDEIRSAILDNIDISPYIGACGDDSYKLGQFRMGIREGIPLEYLDVRFSGKAVYLLRKCYRLGIDATALPEYLGYVDMETIEKLAEFQLARVNLSGMDFRKVPVGLVGVVCKGLALGYPMWLLIGDNCRLDVETIEVLMKGLALGVDVHLYINGEWSKDSLMLLFSYSNRIDLNMFSRYVNSKFGVEELSVLLGLYADGVSVERLCMTDEEGYPVYNSYQMYELGEAIKDGVVTEAMFNPELSDYQMQEMREELKK